MEAGLVGAPVFVGREWALDYLNEKLGSAREFRGSTVFIEGEAGIGKTRLVEEFIKDAGEVKVIKAWCLPEQLEPLFPIKTALRGTDLQHLMEGKPPPLIISAYLMNKDALLIAKAEREESNLDADIFTSMLSAVSNFVSDSLSMMDIAAEGGINVLGMGEYKIIMEGNDYLSLAVIIRGEMNEMLVEDMRNFLSELGDRLRNWDGNMDAVANIKPKLEWFIKSGRYDGRYLVDDPKVRQQNMFDNILLGLKRLSANSPLILFVDDLQWADPTTLTLLHYLSRNLQDSSVMIVGTYRPEDVSMEESHPLRRLIANMSREGLIEVINLTRMDERGVEEIIRSMVPNLELDEKVVARIYRETGGVPFFVIEVVKYLLHNGYIVQDGERYVMREIEAEDIPTRVKDVVKRRIDALDQDDRDILECAAVMGEEFSSDILAEALGIPKIRLLKKLGNIKRKHMLIRYSDGKYRFDHAMIREILYSEIDLELRKEYHRLVADTIVEHYGGSVDDVVGEVAYHYYMAGDQRASKYLIMAGDKARDMYSNEEAARFYSYALKMVSGEEKISLYEKLGHVYLSQGEFEKAIEYYDMVIRDTEDDLLKAKSHREKAVCYERLGDYSMALREIEKSINLVGGIREEYIKMQIFRAYLHIKAGKYKEGEAIVVRYEPEMKNIEGVEDSELADLYTLLGACFGDVGNYDKAKEYLRKALEVSDRAGNLLGMAHSYYDLGIAYHNTGYLNEAMGFYEKCLEIYENIGDPWGLIEIYNALGTLHNDMGKYSEAMEYYKKSLKIARRVGSLYVMGIVYYNMGANMYRSGKLGESLTYYKKSMELASQVNDRIGIAMNYNNMGYVYHDFGDFEKAMELYRESEKIYNEIGDKWGIASVFHSFGCLMKDMGEYSRAEDYLLKSMELAKSIGVMEAYLQSLLCLGELRVITGKEGVEDVLNEFEEIARRVGIRTLIAKGKMVRGMYLAALGKYVEAEELYRKALSTFEEMGAKKEASITSYYLGELLLKMGDQSGRKFVEMSCDYFGRSGMKSWDDRCRELIDHSKI